MSPDFIRLAADPPQMLKRQVSNISFLNKSRRSHIAVILRKLEDPVEDETPL
jgi:hypothetical protein